MHEGRGFTLIPFSLFGIPIEQLHPLMTLIHPDKMEDMVGSWLAIYDEQGELPIWHLVVMRPIPW